MRGEVLVTVLMHPQQRPPCDRRHQQIFVELWTQQHQMRHHLEMLPSLAFFQQRVQLRDDVLGGEPSALLGLAGIGGVAEVGGLAAQQESDGEHVDGQVPPVRAHVDRIFFPNGEVELALERVQQHVNLVHDQNTALPNLENVVHGVGNQGAGLALFELVLSLVEKTMHSPPGAALQLLESIFSHALDNVELFDELEEEGLD